MRMKTKIKIRIKIRINIRIKIKVKIKIMIEINKKTKEKSEGEDEDDQEDDDDMMMKLKMKMWMQMKMKMEMKTTTKRKMKKVKMKIFLGRSISRKKATNNGQETSPLSLRSVHIFVHPLTQIVDQHGTASNLSIEWILAGHGSHHKKRYGRYRLSLLRHPQHRHHHSCLTRRRILFWDRWNHPKLPGKASTCWNMFLFCSRKE